MALTATPPTHGNWARWPHQHHSNNEYVMMDTTMMPYDSRPTTSAPMQRPAMAQQYVPYSVPAPINNMPAPHYPPYNPVFPPNHNGNTNGNGNGNGNNSNFNGSPTMVQPPYKMEFNRRPNLRIVAPESAHHDGSYSRDGRPFSSQSPSTKSEPASAKKGGVNPSLTAKTITSNIAIGDNQIDFNTDVDALMKAIQAKRETEELVKKAEAEAKQQLSQSPHPSPISQKAPEVGLDMNHSSPVSSPGGLTPTDQGGETPKRKRYQCQIEGCDKTFSQKTHLEIHKRAHTGEQPYKCKHIGCGQRFSQLGNLKTHERRHTGEKPYECEICGKRFAQRGNVRAHKITHDQAKPYICKLDNCSKDFTQLGNLKSHQNKFHAQALKELTMKFATIVDEKTVSSDDKELWEYFATLYKNSNKGIKGRGKDRKVGPAVQSHQSTVPSQYPVQQPPAHHTPVHHHHQQQQPHHGLHHPGSLAAYSMSRGPQLPHMMSNFPPTAHRDGSQPYEMFDVETASHTASSSTGTVYEEENGRDLAFGDRMY
ncbi:hypothetical protein MKZ38_000647 [Zalerion maritima]|uniref:C2H2-type domain-containing protein n=1 Tax=Zalerion maritima TaxID=339359 RepID=A0AAD5RRC0_9PEZI|nr:hypothetical protein MKZ38_000647 [Zalerion maritima]